MQKLLADYPLVVEEDDLIGRRLRWDDDDENYDGENELVWQDDNYIRQSKTSPPREWKRSCSRTSSFDCLLHNRYRRPLENERMRDELEKAVNIIWNCRLPSPRLDLVSLASVHLPELIFTKAGKILYREKGKTMRAIKKLKKQSTILMERSLEEEHLAQILLCSQQSIMCNDWRDSRPRSPSSGKDSSFGHPLIFNDFNVTRLARSPGNALSS
ncbi:hypothetical protein LOK49_LG04G02703 [Camellia lanceoleosa]|uniref:Uncharacterized protein n=1 Tax=Camellia lanceoleosa TaxID=1840588 RepID=A0ACC0I4Q0_9ERIC|nr:hypothetical protein LOK49_LG04G02703 [Camellia lanceoleosa]